MSETVTTPSSFSDIIQILNLEEREQLYQITYEYDILPQGVVNTSLFYKVGGASKPYSQQSLEHAYRSTVTILTNCIAHIDTYFASQIDCTIVECNGLRYYKTLLQYTLHGLIFELEKTGMFELGTLCTLYSSCISPINTLEEVVKEVKKHDKTLYHKPVAEQYTELSYSIYSIEHECVKIQQSKRLDSNERDKYMQYIDLIHKAGSVLGSDKPPLLSKQRNGPLIDMIQGDIPRNIYCKIFQKCINTLGISKNVIINEGISSVFDGEHALQIPGNNSYAHKPVARVLKMIVHEIETHFIIQFNHDKLYQIRGSENLFAEEGKAMVMELLYDGMELDTVGYTTSIAILLAGEILDGTDFLSYMKLRSKGLGLDSDPFWLYLRYKRGMSMTYPGVSHQSLTYTRGMRQIKHYLLKGGKFENLYTGKVSLQELPYAMAKERELGVKRLLPPFLGEKILRTLVKGETTNERYVTYLSNKYWFLNKETLEGICTRIKLHTRTVEQVVKYIRPFLLSTTHTTAQTA